LRVYEIFRVCELQPLTMVAFAHCKKVVSD